MKPENFGKFSRRKKSCEKNQCKNAYCETKVKRFGSSKVGWPICVTKTAKNMKTEHRLKCSKLGLSKSNYTRYLSEEQKEHKPPCSNSFPETYSWNKITENTFLKMSTATHGSQLRLVFHARLVPIASIKLNPITALVLKVDIRIIHISWISAENLINGLKLQARR